MNNIRYRRNLLATTIIGGAAMAMAATPSFAQTEAGPIEQAPQQAAEVGEIVVTGSRISRQDYQSTSPIVTVGSEDFQATGSVTIDTLLNDLPQFTPSISSTSNNPSNGGQANIDLRSLGSARTLVLMNGRRVVPSNSDGSVDVNLIPTALIQNIEVISGGASAAYGSDALAGVANFILNENFEGVQLDAQYGETDRGDGITESYSVTVGGNFDDDRGNMVLSLGRSTREEIFNAAREFSSVSGASGTHPLGSTVFDGNNLPDIDLVRGYFGDPTLNNTAAFGFNNSGTLFSHSRTIGFESPGGIAYDGFNNPPGNYAFNTGPLNYLQLPLDRWNVYAGGRYKINESAEVYANALFTNYTADTELAASPAAGPTGFRVPVTNPFITDDLRTFLNARRFTDPRTEGARSEFLYQELLDDEGVGTGVFEQQFNPDGTPRRAQDQSFRLDKRFTDLGGRHSIDEYNVYQITTGVRGAVPQSSWTYDIYASFGRVTNTNVQTGNVSRSSVQALLDAPDGGVSLCAGGFNPFGDNSMSAECLDYIGRSAKNLTETEQRVVEGTLQGRAFDLPAGEVRVALGAQYRQNNYSFDPDTSLAQTNPVTPHLDANGNPDGGTIGGNEIAGFNPSQPLSGQTSSKELFVEALIPVLADLPFIQQLDLTLGYRYADYATIGGTDAYRADIDWTIVTGLRARGGYNRAVRAPSVGELFAPQNVGFPAIGDPSLDGLEGDPCDINSSYRNGPDAAAVRALCLAQGISAGAIDNYEFTNDQVPGVSGGNPDLQEETSDSWSVGLVYQSQFQSPWLSGLSASIDYWNIEIVDAIGAITVDQQLQGCFNATGENPTFDPNNSYCQLFQRDPLSGNIFNTIENNANLGALKTSGVDLQVDWRFTLADVGAPDWGMIDLNTVVSWLENREDNVVEGGVFTDRTGTISSSFGNTFPEWKALSSINWSNGPFSVGARWRRVGEMVVFGGGDELPAIDYFDLNGSWAVNDTVALRAGVNNLTDEEPNVYSPGVQANTDPSTYDVLGRRYYVGITARF